MFDFCNTASPTIWLQQLCCWLLLPHRLQLFVCYFPFTLVAPDYWVPLYQHNTILFQVVLILLWCLVLCVSSRLVAARMKAPPLYSPCASVWTRNTDRVTQMRKYLGQVSGGCQEAQQNNHNHWQQLLWYGEKFYASLSLSFMLIFLKTFN